MNQPADLYMLSRSFDDAASSWESARELHAVEKQERAELARLTKKYGSP